jgi:hypothetical protein
VALIPRRDGIGTPMGDNALRIKTPVTQRGTGLLSELSGNPARFLACRTPLVRSVDQVTPARQAGAS